MITVRYGIEVNHLDDSAHYPRAVYYSFFTSEREMTDQEIREKCERAILPMLQKEYKLDRIMLDPSFIGAKVVEITVTRDVKSEDELSVKGLAVDYYGKEMTDEEIERAWLEIKKKMEE